MNLIPKAKGNENDNQSNNKASAAFMYDLLYLVSA